MNSQNPMTLESALLSSAKWNARTAFDGWDSKDFNLRIQAAVSVGAAVEMLLKYVLSCDSPLHLMEVRPADVHAQIKSRTLLSRETYGPHLAAVKSCSSEEAFHLVRMLGHQLLLVSELKAVMNVRNAAVHLAALPHSDDLQDAIYSMIVAFERAAAGFQSLSFDLATHASMADFLDRYMESRYQAANEKIRTSSRRQSDAGAAGHGKREFLVKQRAFLDREAEQIFGPEEVGEWGYFFPNVRTHNCYNCNQAAMVLCGAEGDSIAEIAPGQYIRSEDMDVDAPTGIILTNVAFECGWCGLTLHPNEILAMSEKGSVWAEDLMRPKAMTDEEYMDEFEPYTLKILRRPRVKG